MKTLHMDCNTVNFVSNIEAPLMLMQVRTNSTAIF